MNIFLLSWSLIECARWHFDRHVVKMIVEIAQLLSTAHHELEREKADALAKERVIYRKTHVNHPMAVWVRRHRNNYVFAARLGLALCAEYTHRYGVKRKGDAARRHRTQSVLEYLLDNVPNALPDDNADGRLIGPHRVTEPPQAMPECYRVPNDAIEAYRRYYMSIEKAHLRSWKGADRERPPWFAHSTNEQCNGAPNTSIAKRKGIVDGATKVGAKKTRL